MKMRAAAALTFSVAMLTLGVPLAATAEGAVITIGPSLAGSYESEDFETPSKTNATVANTSLPIGEGITSSPVDGAVVSWSVIGAKGGPFKLRVIQANASGTYTAVETSAPGVPAGTGLQTFASAVPIKAGQLIGIDNTNGSDEIGLKKVEGAAYAFSLPALVDGVPTPMKPAPPSTKRTVGFNAQILPAPVVSGTSAKHGSIKGGTKMTITGTDLSLTSAVSFGGVAAKSFAVASDTEISAVAPASKKIVSVPVSVTTPAGTAIATQIFTYEGCKVPNLKSKKLKQAKKRAKKSDCKIGKVKLLGDATKKTGEVAKQSPKAGKVLAPGSKVSVKLE